MCPPLFMPTFGSRPLRTLSALLLRTGSINRTELFLQKVTSLSSPITLVLISRIWNIYYIYTVYLRRFIIQYFRFIRGRFYLFFLSFVLQIFLRETNLWLSMQPRTINKKAFGFIIQFLGMGKYRIAQSVAHYITCAILFCRTLSPFPPGNYTVYIVLIMKLLYTGIQYTRSSSSGYFQKASVFYKRVQCPEIFKLLFISSNRLIWFPCSDFSNVCNFAKWYTWLWVTCPVVSAVSS